MKNDFPMQEHLNSKREDKVLYLSNGFSKHYFTRKSILHFTNYLTEHCASTIDIQLRGRLLQVYMKHMLNVLILYTSSFLFCNADVRWLTLRYKDIASGGWQ